MSDSLLDSPSTQEEFALLVNITQQAVGQLVKRGILTDGEPLRRWVRRYATHLRDRAGTPGRAAAIERLAVARAKAQELKNRRAERDVIPAIEVRQVLSRISTRCGRMLEAVPVKLLREVGLEPRAVELVQGIIDEVRHEMADVEFGPGPDVVDDDA